MFNTSECELLQMALSAEEYEFFSYALNRIIAGNTLNAEEQARSEALRKRLIKLVEDVLEGMEAEASENDTDEEESLMSDAIEDHLADEETMDHLAQVQAVMGQVQCSEEEATQALAKYVSVEAAVTALSVSR